MWTIRRQLFCFTVAALSLPSVAFAEIEAARAPDDVSVAVTASSAASDSARATSKARPRSAAKKLVARKSVPSHKSSGETGLASWYGGARGQRTASGEDLDDGQLTAAHKTLPLHSRVRVTNLANGRSVTVRITDRGPHKKGRIIDLSQSAAAQLGMMHKGLTRVRLEPVSPHLINTAG